MTIAKLETNIYPLNVISKINEVVDEVNQGVDVSGKENTSNKVTSLSANSTDSQYPSAKCVYDLVGNIETLLQAV